MLQKYLILFACLFVTKFLIGQSNSFNIITQDVNNFWEAVDSLKVRKDTTQVFQILVIDKASDEFKIFIKKWNIKASDYAYQIKRYPNFYKTLREQSYKLINSQDSIRRIVKRFQDQYPGFKHADICIGFGNFSTGGNIAIEGSRNLVYIGLEYHGPDTTTFTKELHVSTQDYVSRSNFFRAIIHELAHVQQRTHGKKILSTFNGNLLGNRILSEGIADFISRLIVPYGNDGNHVIYGMQNEKSLKPKLKAEILNTGSGNWFGGADSLFLNIPRDLGYFMGARIGESFFNHNNLENSNLTDLIEIKDLKKFISKSQYFNER